MNEIVSGGHSLMTEYAVGAAKFYDSREAIA
jgi:hypothetical protein